MHELRSSSASTWRTCNTLRRHPRSIVYAANQEHLLRPDGLVVLARDYGALFRGLEIKPINERYDAIRSGPAQCVYAFSTDPEIQRLKLVVLQRPEGRLLRHAITRLRGAAQGDGRRESRPAGRDRPRLGVLTTSRIRALNVEVGILPALARKEAAAFLVARGILTQAQANAAGTVRPELLADVADRRRAAGRQVGPHRARLLHPRRGPRDGAQARPAGRASPPRAA